MKPLNIKLYDIARAKLKFNDDDAMEFVSSIHELNDHRFENLVTKEFLSEKINEINTRFNSLELSFEKKFNIILFINKLKNLKDLENNEPLCKAISNDISIFSNMVSHAINGEKSYLILLFFLLIHLRKG